MLSARDPFLVDGVDIVGYYRVLKNKIHYIPIKKSAVVIKTVLVQLLDIIYCIKLFQKTIWYNPWSFEKNNHCREMEEMLFSILFFNFSTETNGF